MYLRMSTCKAVRVLIYLRLFMCDRLWQYGSQTVGSHTVDTQTVDSQTVDPQTVDSFTMC